MTRVPHSLFVSDLHLSAERPAILEAFLEFLVGPGAEAEALYVLGDLFEYWAGDDDLEEPFNRRVVGALRGFTLKGGELYLMHGNRDFLMGEALAGACGARLLEDPVLVDVHGTPTLLMHGDTLCVDDADYMAFRAQVRAPAWREAFLALPLEARKARIAALRTESRRAQSAKPPEIMDANEEAIGRVLRERGYPRLIHGHTHRPARHVHHVDGRACERWVLPDWYEQGGYLRCDARGCEARKVFSEDPGPAHHGFLEHLRKDTT